MNGKYKAQQLKSSEYYTGIIDVSFIPESEIPIELKARKGDPVYEYRGLFGNKRVQVGEYQEDKFSISDTEDYHSYCCGETLGNLESSRYHRIVRDGKLYRQAKVTATQKNGKSDTIWFNTNDDAINYLEEVKNKCSQCGNKLL
jgi:hypothetical protein